MYYVDIDTGEYEEFVHSEKLEKFNIPPKGKDFFSQSVQNAEKCVHPDNLSLVLMIHDKATVQEKNLHSAERMARLDELTGIKNINAFAEFTKDINLKIKTGDEFAVLFTDSDYDQREQLLEKLRDESYENAHSRTGPTVACGMAGYNSKRDRSFEEVFKRADKDMYENKNEIKSQTLVESFRQMNKLDKAIPPDRKRMLDGLFGAMVTIANESYVYLNDIKAYREAVDAVFCGKSEIKAI